MQLVNAAVETDIIQDIDPDHDQRTNDQCARKILLRILQLGVDTGRNDPALISKRSRNYGSQQHGRIGRIGLPHRLKSGNNLLCRERIRKIVNQNAVGQAARGTHHGHEQQRNELDDRCRYLNFSRKFRRERVDRVAADKEQAAQAQALGTNDGEAQQHAEIARRYPCKHRGHGWIVDHRHEPADKITVALADRHLRIIHETVDK